MFGSDFAVTPLAAAGKIPDLLRSARAGSLVEYTRTTHVEPVTLVDEACLRLPYVSDLMQVASMIFSGYYLQAIAITLNVGKVDVIRLLDKVNPNRSPGENAGMFIGDMLSEESYQYSLPVPGQAIGLEAYGLEAAPPPKKSPQQTIDELKKQVGDLKSDLKKERDKDEDKPVEAGFGKDTIRMSQEIANLSVGRLLEVHVESEGHKATIPVAVRLIVSSVSADSLIHILSIGSKDTSVKERYHAWRSGQITFIKDLILCQDLIDEHRKALLKDTTGYYASTLARRDANRAAGVLSGNPSVATASSIMVISSHTAARFEGSQGGKFKDFKFRERIFANTYAMLLFIVDDEWGKITLYTRSIDTATNLTIRDLKSSSGKNNVDVAEILKAYQLGQSPSL